MSLSLPTPTPSLSAAWRPAFRHQVKSPRLWGVTASAFPHLLCQCEISFLPSFLLRDVEHDQLCFYLWLEAWCTNSCMDGAWQARPMGADWARQARRRDTGG